MTLFGNTIEVNDSHLSNAFDSIVSKEVDKIMFSDLPVKKKRIAVRKLRKDGLEPKFIKLFLKLLEYIEQV